MSPNNKTVRVFISSTFRDMHAERDHLITVVFPELRERLEALSLELYDVDLRWGVPEKGLDGELANSWAYCKQWIERVEPFFISLLGQRYGWVPSASEIRDEIDRVRYGGLSITEMEIRYAVFSGDLHRRSFFYFRSAVVPVDAVPDIYREFVDPNEQERLRLFKEEIAGSGQPVRHYNCHWNGEGFTNMTAFGNMVLEDLWSGILRDERYVSSETWREVLGHAPDGDFLYTDEGRPLPREVWQKIVAVAKPAPASPQEAEAGEMAAFAAGRLRWFHGRAAELERLSSFVNDDDPSSNSSHLFVVHAVAGQGKSSLLAKLAEQLSSTSHLVITHFVGATERGTSTRSLLERLDQELQRNGIKAAREYGHNYDLESLSKRFAARLANYDGNRRLVLIIDAINQLTDGHDMSWLPTQLGSSVRLILSTLSNPTSTRKIVEANVLNALQTRTPQPQWLEIVPLEDKDIRAIVVEYLREYCKELDLVQIETICHMVQAHNPLYLLVMLNELRTLGGNDMNKVVLHLITEMQAHHPDTTQLFDWVLQRLEIFGRDVVELWCIYLALGREGMSSRELSDLVSRKLGSSAAQTSLLIERSLRRYLQKRGPQLDFFHGQLREAVQRRYLPKESPHYHAEIAEYFETRWNESNVHALRELPYHLVRGKSHGLLKALYKDFSYLETVCTVLDVSRTSNGDVDHLGIFELVSGIQDVLQVLNANSVKETTQLAGYLQAVSDVLLDRGLLFRKHPKAVKQEIANYIEPAVAASVGFHGGALKRDQDGLLVNKRVLTSPTIPGHTAEITALAASPSGRHFLSGGKDGYVGYWQIDRPNPLWLIGAHKSEVINVSFSPDGQRGLSAGDDGTVFLWDVDQGRHQQLFDQYLDSSKTTQWPASFGGFLDNNNLLIIRGQAMKYEISSGLEVWRTFEIANQFARQNQRFMDLSSQAAMIAMGDGHTPFNSQQIQVYDVHNGERLSTLEFPSVLSRLALAWDGTTLLAVDSQGRLRAYEVRSGTQIISVQTEPFFGLCRSYNERFFFAYDRLGKLHRISVASGFEMESPNSIEARQQIPNSLYTMTCLPDNRTLVMGDGSGTLHLVDGVNANVLRTWGSGRTFLMGTIFSNGKGALGVQGIRLAGKAKTGYKLTFLESSGEQKTVDDLPHSQLISGVVAIDSKRALTVDKGGVAAFWKGRQVLKVHRISETDFTACAAWHEAGLGVGATRDDEVVIIGQGEKTMVGYVPGSRFALGKSSGIAALAVGGKPMAIFAVYFSGAVQFAQGTRHWHIQGHRLMGSAAALDMEHQLAASGDIMGEVRVWHCLSNDNDADEYFPHQGEVTALAFDRNGQLLYSAGSDRFICEIDLALKKITRATVLPALPIALLLEAGGRLSALDSQGNIYEFSTRSPDVSPSRKWNWHWLTRHFDKQ